MTESCPIHPSTVDDRATRFGAGLTILITGLAIVTGRFWIALLLALDFGLRSRGWNRFSPVAQAAKGLRSLSGLAPRPINAGPKRFAALLGLVFSLAIALAQALHHPRAALAVAIILGLCASLEAFLGYCLGCKVYSLLQAVFPGSGHPGSGHPGSGHPGSGHPGSGHPGSGHPGTSAQPAEPGPIPPVFRSNHE
jgi:hypothetical protein